MNVVFATHEGDIVENGDSVTEWERMSDVMNTLDGEVPYSALLGNHDFAVTGDRESSTENYRTYFGESRYEDYDWFGGTAPDDRVRSGRWCGRSGSDPGPNLLADARPIRNRRSKPVRVRSRFRRSVRRHPGVVGNRF